jgi:Flp pilus assembly protein TadD
MLIRNLVCGLAMTAALLPATGADTDPAPPPTPSARAEPDPLGPARQRLAGKRWAEAIAELRRVNLEASADWHNLMGYAHRKLAPPDLAAAERHYDAALKLAPSHRGALEYSGELYLMKGELPRAEQRLLTLARVCAGPCEEHVDLRRAIDRFKANGNRFVASP